MKRPLHPDYDTAFQRLGESIKLAKEAQENGTIGTVTDHLYEAVIALDDCFSFDGQESRFTRARPILQAWKPEA